MMKAAFATLALATMTMTAQAGVVINEGFDNVPGLSASGWSFSDHSTPGGATPGWFQGTPGTFDAQAGAPYSYAAANYGNAPAGGTIDNWLYTPVFDATNGADVSFYLRAGFSDGYSDKISYGFEGAVLTTVFPVPTSDWTLYTAHIDAGTVGKTRFAFQYAGNADDSSFVGLDSVTVAEVPEPGGIALLAGGMLALSFIRRRTRN